jgi:hypothetical protein
MNLGQRTLGGLRRSHSPFSQALYIYPIVISRNLAPVQPSYAATASVDRAGVDFNSGIGLETPRRTMAEVDGSAFLAGRTIAHVGGWAAQPDSVRVACWSPVQTGRQNEMPAPGWFGNDPGFRSIRLTATPGHRAGVRRQ